MRKFLIVLVILGLIGAYFWNAVSTRKAAAEKAIGTFHEAANRKDFAGIYAASHAELKKVSTEPDFVGMLTMVQEKLGSMKSTEANGWRVNARTEGTEVTIDQKTTFTQGTGDETFIFRMENDQPELIGYNIKSDALKE